MYSSYYKLIKQGYNTFIFSVPSKESASYHQNPCEFFSKLNVFFLMNLIAKI